MSNHNKFIEFLTLYGRSADNEAAYDESLAAAADRLKIDPPSFDHPWLEEIVSLLSSPNPPSIILTGNAGDGKTNLCRRVVSRLGGNILPGEWDDEAFPATALPSGKTLVVVKDFTARGEQQRHEVIDRLAKSVFDGTSGEVLLVAANEGILTRKAVLVATGDGAYHPDPRLADLLSILLSGCGTGESSGSQPLRVFDLSCYPARDMLQMVIRTVLDHEGWSACDACPAFDLASRNSRCHIFINRQRLRDPLVLQRLSDLIEMLDLNSEHVTIRQLYALIANAITGHSKAPRNNPMVSNCSELQEQVYVQSPMRYGAYFQNLFGHNIGRSDRTRPFSTLLKLGVGEETSNRIDRLLVYGDIEKPRDFSSVMSLDDPFVDLERYQDLARSYREGDPEKTEVFLDELFAQRRRLYFELPTELTSTYSHSSLTVYHSASNFRDRILKPVANDQDVDEATIKHMVKGLNRVFIGGLIESDDAIYLATSSRSSQSRLSSILIHKINNDDRPYTGVSFEHDPDTGSLTTYLLVKFRDNVIGRLPLTLSRYEFLTRVADGVLPASFSVQQYEDILVFKSQLIREFERHKTDVPLQALQITAHGSVEARKIVTLEV